MNVHDFMLLCFVSILAVSGFWSKWQETVSSVRYVNKYVCFSVKLFYALLYKKINKLCSLSLVLVPFGPFVHIDITTGH